jgi:hypothetical protein
MKKILSILLITSLANLSFGQIQQGKWLLGSSVNFKTLNNQITGIAAINSSSTYSSLNITPEANYMISPNIMIGGGLLYGNASNSVDLTTFQTASSQVKNYSAINSKTYGGFIQAKYMVNISPKIWWNASLKAGLGKSEYSFSANNSPYAIYVTTTGTTTTTNQIGNINQPAYKNASLTSQFMFLPFKKLGFQLDIGGINYLVSSSDITNADITTKDFSFDLSPTKWSFGLFYVLGSE